MAKDVCEVLGLGNVTEALRGLDEDEKAEFSISEVRSDGIAQARKYVIISEPGLYALVFRSRKPEARTFSKWVRGDVLPTFRQNGFVGTPLQSRVGPWWSVRAPSVGGAATPPPLPEICMVARAIPDCYLLKKKEEKDAHHH